MSERFEKSEIAISADGLTKRFGKGASAVTAVNGASFEVASGTLFSLLGVNGAGKTTTIRMLTGLLKPDEGHASLFGYDITDEKTASERRRIVGLSPQETSTAGNLTVRENLIMTAQIYGFRDAKQRADAMIERLNLTDSADRMSKTLSGGMRRRLSIGMGIVTDPKILFLDEPTLGLDVIARRELWRFIEELKKSVTIVLTTHYMEEAEALSDRIAVMVGGMVKASGTLDELRAYSGCINKESLEDVFIKIAEGGEIR